LTGEVTGRHTSENERATALGALERAHARLEALMRAPAAGDAHVGEADSMRDGIREIDDAIEPALGELRRLAPERTRDVEYDLARAIAQLSDDGASLASDRSEFVVSALLPVAASLEQTRSALLEGER